MAFINYLSQDELPEDYQGLDPDNIIQIHGVSHRVMKSHLGMYIDLMKRNGPIARELREMVAVAVSAHNHCVY